MAMVKAETTRCITFSMTWRSEQLCFVFRGTTKEAVFGTIGSMEQFFGSFAVSVEKGVIINGKCCSYVQATVTAPKTDILPEADWPLMITRLLSRTTQRDVSYIADYNKFLNT